MRKNFSKMARLALNLRFSCLDIKNDEIGVLTPWPVLPEFLKSVEYRKNILVLQTNGISEKYLKLTTPLVITHQ